MENAVEKADRAECAMRLKANNLVDFSAERLERIWRRDRHGQDKLLRRARADGAQGGARRRAGGDAVIDDDGDAPFNRRRGRPPR